MQIKTAMKYQFTLLRTVFINKSTNNKCRESVEKTETSFTVGGNVNWCSQYGNSMEFHQKNKIYYNMIQVSNFSGINLDKAIIQKDTCTLIFIGTLFTTAKTEKKPKYPSTHEWI